MLSTLQAISLPVGSSSRSDTANGSSFDPAVSADGRYVAFVSGATNLVVGQTGPSGQENVFLLDRTADSVSLVSHIPGPGNLAAAPTSGNSFGLYTESAPPLISRDGRYIAYGTTAPQISGSTDLEVIVYDRTTGQNTLVSHGNGSLTSPLPGFNFLAAMSPDGRYILFESKAGGVVPNQVSNSYDQYFLYDQVQGTTVLVSHAAGQNNAPADVGVDDYLFGTDGYLVPSPAVADDGTVAYASPAGDLVSGVNPGSGGGNVYLYSPGTGSNQIISVSSDAPTVAAGGCGAAVRFSGDGSTVVYISTAPNLVPGQTNPPQGPRSNVYRYSRSTGKTTLVSGANGSPTATANADSGIGFVSTDPVSVIAVSHDGEFIAFQSYATDLVAGETGAAPNVFLFDDKVPGLTLVSRASVPYNYNGDRAFLSISDDGSLIAYTSDAGDIVIGQTSTAPPLLFFDHNLFLYQRLTGQTSLVSGADSSATATGDSPSTDPAISGDGSVVVFDSGADNLVAGIQYLSNGNVFAYVTGSPSTTLISRAAAGGSFATSFSGDGGFTVFTSTADDLVLNQVSRNSNQNVFLHNKRTNTNVLVNHVPGSTNTTGDGGVGTSPNSGSTAPPPSFLQPVLSADGQFVTFASFDDDLVTGETVPAGSTPGQVLAVYLYNVQTGQITLVNHVPGQPAAVAGTAWNPVLSGNDGFVTYLFGSPPAGQPPFSSGSLALYDVAHDTTTTITPASYLTNGGTASRPAIDDAGRFVAYEDQGQVYVFDRTRTSVTLVSHDSATPTMPANAASTAAVLSHDGSAIAFVSAATDLVPGQTPSGAAGLANVFLYNIANGSVSLVSGVNGSLTTTGNGNSDSPAIDGDGSYVAYRSDATDLVTDQSGSNVYEFNTLTRTQTLVSHAAGDPTVAAGGASDPVIDDDGHLVAYVSTAGNLIPGQGGPANIKNVFVWLRQTDANILASGQNGSPTVGGDADSDGPLLTRDSFPGFSSRGRLLPGLGGASVAYINTLVDLALSANVIAPGSPAGTVIGTLTVSSLLAGQYLPPKYSLSAAQASDALFALEAAARNGASLLTQFQAGSSAAQAYPVVVHVDIGFGDDAFLLQVYGPAPGPAGSGGGGGSAGGDSVGGAEEIKALLVAVRVGKKKATRLMVEVFDALTGARLEAFVSPFQKPAYRNIQVSVHPGSGGPGVVVSARKGKKAVTRTFSG